MKFDLLKSKYIEHLVQKGKLAELTMRNYVNDINTFKKYLDSEKDKWLASRKLDGVRCIVIHTSFKFINGFLKISIIFVNMLYYWKP